jgi:hypothetical protein
LALQVKQDQYVKVIAERDEALANAKLYQGKLEQTQLDFNQDAKRIEAEHQAELAAVLSTKNQYAKLWQEALKPTPFYATWWFCLLIGAVAGIGGLKFVQWAKKVHGGFWRLVIHIWDLRPRVTVTKPVRPTN